MDHTKTVNYCITTKSYIISNMGAIYIAIVGSRPSVREKREGLEHNPGRKYMYPKGRNSVTGILSGHNTGYEPAILVNLLHHTVDSGY